jgi:hypothetical protein
MLLEDYISHRIPRILRFSSIDVSYANVFEPTEFVASSATTAGAVFTKTSDTSLWVLRAKLRNSSSDSAHCMVKSVSSFRFAKKKKGKQKVLSLQKVNQRREVNYREFKPYELNTETVLFSFPLNGRANYICRFIDLIKDVVSSTPG